MEIRYGMEEINNLKKDNPSSKVGGHHLMINSFKEQTLDINECQDIIDTLHSDGCDLIFFSVIDFNRFVCIWLEAEYIEDNNTYDYTSIINSISNLGIDYLIFFDDWIPEITQDNRDKINNILNIENYKNRYQLLDNEYLMLQVNMYLQHIDNFKVQTVKTLNNAFHYYPWKDCIVKYYDSDILLSDITYDVNGIPKYESSLSEDDVDILNFGIYLRDLTEVQWRNKQLIEDEGLALGGLAYHRILSLDTYDVVNIIYTGLHGNRSMNFERIFNN